MTIVEMIGFLGTVIVTVAYIPQIVQLWQTKIVDGISISTWVWWLIGTVMILVHAFSTGDRVFIISQVLSILLIIVILGLVWMCKESFHNEDAEPRSRTLTVLKTLLRLIQGL